jgi:hypothetical protein
MNFLHSNKTKKISASFFMSLFVFVLAVKTLHSHEFSYSNYNNNSKQTTTVTPNFSCSICEFQLAKDSDTETAVINLTTPCVLLHTYYHFKTGIIAFAEKDFSVRGPPVMA